MLPFAFPGDLGTEHPLMCSSVASVFRGGTTLSLACVLVELFGFLVLTLWRHGL